MFQLKVAEAKSVPTDGKVELKKKDRHLLMYERKRLKDKELLNVEKAKSGVGKAQLRVGEVKSGIGKSPNLRQCLLEG